LLEPCATTSTRRSFKTEAEARLPGLKFGRTLWIAAAAGGPFVYTGLPLSEAHAELNLTAEEFAEVGAEIVRALDFYEVPEQAAGAG
jgi:hemoglobin